MFEDILIGVSTLVLTTAFFTTLFAVIYLGVEYTGRYVDRKRKRAGRG